jgi:hypothetical protein
MGTHYAYGFPPNTIHFDTDSAMLVDCTAFVFLFLSKGAPHAIDPPYYELLTSDNVSASTDMSTCKRQLRHGPHGFV